MRSTAKSVAAWVWTTYTGCGRLVNRGVMDLAGSGLPLERKQSLAAARTAAVRRAASAERITAAAARVASPLPTVTAVAAEAGVSRDCVRRSGVLPAVADGRCARNAEIAAMRLEGLTWCAIGARLGISARAAQAAHRRNLR